MLVAGLLIGIGVNATYFQNARHPAPLFATAPEKLAPQKPVSVAATPLPAPRPADLAVASLPAPRTAAPMPLRPPVQLTQAETPAPKRDPIAALIKGDPQADSAPANPKIAAAQRALQKVGFVVKPDGVFGAGTRQAIERFERDRGLPVTGELAGRTVRELAAQSGVAIP